MALWAAVAGAADAVQQAAQAATECAATFASIRTSKPHLRSLIFAKRVAKLLNPRWQLVLSDLSGPSAEALRDTCDRELTRRIEYL